ncbi:Flavohemoprotein, partial [Giardia duodenalis]
VADWLEASSRSLYEEGPCHVDAALVAVTPSLSDPPPVGRPQQQATNADVLLYTLQPRYTMH